MGDEVRKELQERVDRLHRLALEGKVDVEKEAPKTKTTWIDTLLIVNLGIAILISIVAVIQNREYLDNFILLGVIAVIIFVFVTTMILVLLMGLALFARSRKDWEFIQKAFITVDRNFQWIVYTCLIGTSIGLYLFVLPAFPPVHDPFDLNAINPLVGIIYLIWWFFGFINIALLITFKIDILTRKGLTFLTDKIIATE